MKCANHPETDAVGMCVYCGKPFCSECIVEVQGKMYCKGDLGNVLDDARHGSNRSNGSPIINITNSNDTVNRNTNANLNTNSYNNMGYGLPPRKSKMLALLLCILGFFGFAGVHRIYVGKVGSGILYFFTGGICGVGTIIDLILILTGGFRDSYGQPVD